LPYDEDDGENKDVDQGDDEEEALAAGKELNMNE
jgi:hypothetical protein